METSRARFSELLQSSTARIVVSMVAVFVGCSMLYGAFFMTNFVSYLVVFLFGAFWSLSMALVAITFFVFGFTDKKTSYSFWKFGSGVVRPSEDLAAELFGQKKSLEDQILEDKDKVSITWGNLNVQVMGKKRRRQDCFCALKGSTLFFQARKAEGFQGEVKAAVLSGAYVRFTDRSDHDSVQKSIELVHPLRTLLHKVEYMFLQSDEIKTLQRWYLALRAAGCVPMEQLYSDPKPTTDLPTAVHFEQVLRQYRSGGLFGKIEPGDWANALLARIFIAIRDSPDIRRKILTYLEKHLSLKIEERNLQGRLSEVVIRQLSFGSKPPRISHFQVSEPGGMDDAARVAHDVSAEFEIDYSDGDACFGLDTVLSLPLKQLHVSILITCTKLTGRAQICIPPHPFGQLWFAFKEKPDMRLDFKVTFGGRGFSLASFPSRLREFIHDRIVAVFNERFVLPNRKYVRIPGIPKIVPPVPKTTLKVGSEVSPSLPSPAPDRSSESTSTSTPTESLDSQELVKEIENLFDSRTAAATPSPSPPRATPPSTEDTADEDDLTPAEFESSLSRDFKLNPKHGGVVKSQSERQSTVSSSTTKLKEFESESRTKETWGEWGARKLKKLKEKRANGKASSKPDADGEDSE